VHCKVCKEPFAATDGEYALKYFLVGKGRRQRHNGIDLHMRHSSARPVEDRPAVQQQQQVQPKDDGKKE
jgi:hypothetical protein